MGLGPTGRGGSGRVRSGRVRSGRVRSGLEGSVLNGGCINVYIYYRIPRSILVALLYMQSISPMHHRIRPCDSQSSPIPIPSSRDCLLRVRVSVLGLACVLDPEGSSRDGATVLCLSTPVTRRTYHDFHTWCNFSLS
jgi:hypothetical protein